MTLRDLALQYNREIKAAIETIVNALNPGQKKQILKDEKVKALLERYGIEVQ